MKTLNDCYQKLAAGAKVLDVGCLGFSQMHLGNQLRPNELHYFGVDYCDQKDVPEHFIFKKVDLNKESIPFPDDFFDFVVAKHIIEHLSDPITFFAECLRVCKPGGLLYLAAPSERSLLLPGMPFEKDKFFSSSFFDDPTHLMRPWTPQSLYRLTKLFGCDPKRAGYLYSWKYRVLFPLLLPLALLVRSGKLFEKTLWSTIGWESFLIAEKPLQFVGTPTFNYYVPVR